MCIGICMILVIYSKLVIVRSITSYHPDITDRSRNIALQPYYNCFAIAYAMLPPAA